MLCLTLGGLILAQKSCCPVTALMQLNFGASWDSWKDFFGMCYMGTSWVLYGVWALTPALCITSGVCPYPFCMEALGELKWSVVLGKAHSGAGKGTGIPLPCLPARITPVCTGCTSTPPELLVALHQSLLSASGCQKFGRKKMFPYRTGGWAWYDQARCAFK